jgi:hypothetical protein
MRVANLRVCGDRIGRVAPAKTRFFSAKCMAATIHGFFIVQLPYSRVAILSCPLEIKSGYYKIAPHSLCRRLWAYEDCGPLYPPQAQEIEIGFHRADTLGIALKTQFHSGGTT